jgi:hypothetical protein
MELAGIPVPQMNWSAQDLPQALRRFKALAELIFEGPMLDKGEEVKVKYLQIWSGEEGIELISTWGLREEEKKKLKTYWDKFDAYVKPKSNFRISRFKLRSLKQEPQEKVDTFAKRIRMLVGECKYVNNDDHMIDALIYGTSSKVVQSKLLQKDDGLTFDQAMEVARTEEATQQQMEDLSEKTVHAYTHTRPQAPKNKLCGKCGREHASSPRTKCPAFGTTCSSCGKRNHWATLCGQKKEEKHPKREEAQTPKPRYKSRHRPQQRVHDLTTAHNDEDDTEQTLYFGSLEIAHLSSKEMTQALVDVEVKRTASTSSSLITCKIDTGAEGNVLPVSLYRKIVPQQDDELSGLQKSDTIIKAYGGSTIPQYGTCRLIVSYASHEETSTFHVVKCDGPAILGLPSCRALQLVTLNHAMNVARPEEASEGDPEERKKILEEFADCFQGVGCFQGEYSITVDPAVPPVVHPPRRVPISLKEKLKEELDKLQNQEILAKVVEPTDWVNSCVCTTKANGSLRLCLDPKDLNQAIKRPHHTTPTLDDVLPKLNGAKFFSILDARSGYWNIKLTESSSYLTTFNTPYGRYRFKRLPFGLVCAQDVFQRKVDETFGDLRGVTGIADDIVVVGYKEDGSDHDENLRAVIERARETGLRFNPDKLKVKRTKIKFFGNVIGARGLEPDPEKVKAIEKMQVPHDVKELQTFLGLATYLGRYTPRLSSIAAPLRDL